MSVARPRWRSWSALAGPALLALPAAPAHAAIADGVEIGEPWLEYRFTTTFGNGEQMIEELPTQIGGAIDEKRDPESIPMDLPEMAASINEGARTFWVQALSPRRTPIRTEDPVRYASRIFISQSFRKDEADATLAYVMSAAHVIGLDPSAANDDLGPSGFLSFSLDLTRHGTRVVSDNFFHAAGFAGIHGLGRAWRPDPAPAGTARSRSKSRPARSTSPTWS